MLSTVHYAPPLGKCLSHRPFRYAARMETANERLRKLRSAKFRTIEEGALFVGANLNTYRQHENDTRGLGGLPRKAAELYAQKYRVSLDWLLTGRGEDSLDDEPSEDELERMIREVIDAEVTVDTRLSDLPRIVAPALREQLERFRFDRALHRQKAASSAPDRGAQSPAPTMPSGSAGSRRT